MFYIPIENYNKLEKKLNTIKNKGGKIELIKGEPVILAVTEGGFAWPKVQRDSVTWRMSPKHKFIPIEVSGSYEIPGWEFIATVEHTSNGNIIRKVSGDVDVPERYKNSSPECEHCHKIRDRKDTYIIKNTETGDYKQIGKTCLRDYTGGMDSKVAAQIAEIINDPNEFFRVIKYFFLCN